jgi:hypothetical protein
MKVSIKISYKELPSLADYIGATVATDEPGNDRISLILHCIISDVWLKLKKKCLVLEPKNYTLNLEPFESLAFIEWFNDMPIDTSSFEGNTIRKMILEIDRQITNQKVRSHLVNTGDEIKRQLQLKRAV